MSKLKVLDPTEKEGGYSGSVAYSFVRSAVDEINSTVGSGEIETRSAEKMCLVGRACSIR